MAESKNSKRETPAPIEATSLSIQSAVFKEMPVVIKAQIGEVAMTVSELLALKQGSVIGLSTKLSDQIELTVNGAVVARGEIVAVDDSFGVRIAQIAELS